MNMTINKKTYVSRPLTMSITREAFRIFTEWTKIAEKANSMSASNDDENKLETLKKVSGLLEDNTDILERKCELLVRFYDNQFSLDELYDGVTTAEVEAEFMKIIRSINGAIEKNA